jgi:adenine-specific DNA-methyltransferase
MTNEEKITNNIKVPNKDLEALRLHFPQCFDKDGNFQLEKFKNNLAEKEINFSTESYGLDWLGKSYARLLASDPATTLLQADETHNAKPENANSENLLIKGDNLEVLKHLTNAYYEKVKMIYIDPPYNTGSDGFVYNDDRKYTVKELQNLIGVDAEKAKRILDFTQQKSNSHSAWLTFLYPRLYIAKQLLKEDGVIFVSIDDNEVAQLRLLMDDVFGEENFVANVIWEKKFAPSNDAKWFSDNHDHILVFSKNKEIFRPNLLERKGESLERYKNPDQDIRGVWVSGDMTVKTYNAAYDFEIITPSGKKISPPKGICWRFSKTKFNELIEDNRVWFGEKGENVPRLKRFLNEVKEGITPLTIWYHKDVAHNQEAAQELRKLFDGELFFQTPKPIRLIERIIRLGSDYSDIILDFFAGSGATGDAVLQMNAEDGGNRRFILVQLPEPIDSKNKNAYDFIKNELNALPTIFEITKERLIRAANKIKKENISHPAQSEKVKCDGLHDEHCPACKGEYTIKVEAKDAKDFSGIDLGFKIFETMPIWEDYNFEADQFDSTQTLFEVGKLTERDINALLTTWKTYDGIALTQDLTKIDVSGYPVYYGNGKLYLMHKGFTTDNLKGLLEKIDVDKTFNPTSIICFGYHFESKNLRELAENLKSYTNKKNIDIDFVTRY